MDNLELSGQALEKAIAKRIREKRMALGWSLDKLAQVTGLSKGYLSQIENCEKNPPISTLTKIAYGLGENVIELIAGEQTTVAPTKFSLIRPSQRRQIIHAGAAPGSIYESVAHKKPDRRMDSYIVNVSPDWPDQPMMHEGQELAYILEGRIEFFYDGQTHTAEPGDCMYLDSDRPHMARRIGDREARVLVVFFNSLRSE